MNKQLSEKETATQIYYRQYAQFYMFSGHVIRGVVVVVGVYPFSPERWLTLFKNLFLVFFLLKMIMNVIQSIYSIRSDSSYEIVKRCTNLKETKNEGHIKQ